MHIQARYTLTYEGLGKLYDFLVSKGVEVEKRADGGVQFGTALTKIERVLTKEDTHVCEKVSITGHSGSPIFTMGDDGMLELTFAGEVVKVRVAGGRGLGISFS